MSRRLEIAPLSPEETKHIAVDLCNFFAPIRNMDYGQELGLAAANAINPLNLCDFLNLHRKRGFDLWHRSEQIGTLARALERSGILTAAGFKGGIPSLSTCYLFMYQVSQLAKLGLLWLGPALGPGFVVNEVKTVLARLTGMTQEGDMAVGSGIMIGSNIVITCAHVVTDIKLDDAVEIGSQSVRIERAVYDEHADVGVVLLAEEIKNFAPDLAFRDGSLLEEVIIMGYPTIPRGIKPTVTCQTGEISGFLEETMDGQPFLLFSAIARPGNSGGPVLTMDGRCVGIVTRTLERPREVSDDMSPLPFFSAIPSSTIRESVKTLIGVDIPWEDYR